MTKRDGEEADVKRAPGYTPGDRSRDRDDGRRGASAARPGPTGGSAAVRRRPRREEPGRARGGARARRRCRGMRRTVPSSFRRGRRRRRTSRRTGTSSGHERARRTPRAATRRSRPSRSSRAFAPGPGSLGVPPRTRSRSRSTKRSTDGKSIATSSAKHPRGTPAARTRSHVRGPRRGAEAIPAHIAHRASTIGGGSRLVNLARVARGCYRATAMADARECPLCGATMRLKRTEQPVNVPGNPEHDHAPHSRVGVSRVRLLRRS